VNRDEREGAKKNQKRKTASRKITVEYEFANAKNKLAIYDTQNEIVFLFSQ